jgi:integrase
MRFNDAVETYIVHRRTEGFAFVNQAGRLRALARQVGDVDMRDLSTGDMDQFLREGDVGEITALARYDLVVRFIKHWQARDQLIGFQLSARPRHCAQVFVPHIYSTREIRDLLLAARNKTSAAIAPQTFETLLLFLYGSGSSLTSAITLRAEDLDLAAGKVILENQRLQGSRTIPLNTELVDVLKTYAAWKDRVGLQGERFFPKINGKPLIHKGVCQHFNVLLQRTKCARRDDIQKRPRLYDLRATFAVHRISGWIKSGADLGRMLPALAAYLGQIDLTTAERFLSLCPDRFQKELEKLSPSKSSPSWRADPSAMAFLKRL